MKKVKPEITDELRPEYKRSDFGKIVCGKYANRIKALRYLLEVAKASTSLAQRSSGLR